MMPDPVEDARKLAITGGAIIMFLLLIGLSKTGVDTETLFYFLPIIWLAGIILCGMLMRLCALVDKLAPPTSTNSGLASNIWDAELSASELNAFGVPRGNALLPIPLGRNNFLSRASSLPKYEEVVQSVASTRITIEQENSSSDSEHLLPPTYDEAVARCSAAERQQSVSLKN
uniref:Uncharacterized protein n=1 Tax=Plectus sambesii TaxID=2011161 RepID=A0A914WGT8_9BILA